MFFVCLPQGNHDKIFLVFLQGHFANVGILPYVLMLLHDSINKSPVFTLSFDESLNKVTQECEMDLIICF